MKAMVVYSSRTGNTKKVANGIFAGIPGESKDIQSLEEYSGRDADVFFVGFWADKGTCDMTVVDFLSGLHGKKVVLFGTCGMGRDSAYMQAIEDRVKVWIPEDSVCLGAYMCQGKMPEAVGARFEAGLRQEPENEALKARLENFRRAMAHPNRRDLEALREAVKQALSAVSRS